MLLGTHSLAAFKQLELFWVYNQFKIRLPAGFFIAVSIIIPRKDNYPSCSPHSRFSPKKRVSSSAMPGSHLRVVCVSPTDR
ncbi:hypothetical protein DU964_15450 [Salmonella enterica subsp. enterica serovar Manhattan]|nr:hypothetical protein [Salmonella enterica subsp. enterica serovar Manhattan]EBV4630624.1 hypothetical protein [Salmonella enterica subsp. enterica serovar Manhattan]EBW7083099.1 hypothetical protein [Salmonella enterica subsp. enterica serovar Manhattan]EBX5955876.1 hypothetical protein [Salmonella enterica subsp. enterica serovar Manhattan]EBY2486163.1 hypothetical protein [Salmonella enterica subsp. enterica serovar Manhattan]